MTDEELGGLIVLVVGIAAFMFLGKCLGELGCCYFCKVQLNKNKSRFFYQIDKEEFPVCDLCHKRVEELKDIQGKLIIEKRRKI